MEIKSSRKSGGWIKILGGLLNYNLFMFEWF